MKNSSHSLLLLLLLTSMSAAFVACSTEKYLGAEDLALKKVRVTTDSHEINLSTYKDYVRQRPTSRWFGLVKYPPVAYSGEQTAFTQQDMTTLMQNNGYLNAETVVDTTLLPKKRISVSYHLVPGKPYFIRRINRIIADTELCADSLLKGTLLHEGSQLSINTLDDERKRITAYLGNQGYYHFHKDFIHYAIDTLSGDHRADVTMYLDRYKASKDAKETGHTKYLIGKVNFLPAEGETLPLRQSVLDRNTWINEGEPYSVENLKQTYSNFSRLGAVRYTNIKMQERPDTALIDCDVQLMTQRPSTISFAPEGTNTAGDMGAAATLSYQNRNLFRGSELLSIELRGAYEAIRGLQGYENTDYIEYGAEARLQQPRFFAPWISSDFTERHHASTEFSVSINRQNRPEFQRYVTRATWRYRWNKVGDTGVQWRYDLLDVNYIRMPWVSNTFKSEYLDDPTNRNAILRYNYQDLFIMAMRLTSNLQRKNDAFKLSIEVAGNVLQGAMALSGAKKNEEGYYRLFNVAFAQYAKADFDWTHLIKMNTNNELAFHVNAGVAIPYGNSSILPFEKRYFSGGANSVRGWSVRGLGPGSFRGTNGRIDFINQTGDVKLDLSMEYRTFLFWKFYGAAFMDAGNIWTLREYQEQPGGQFKFNEFYKQIAVAYGLGLRMNFSYFFLRFDFGMKAVNPAYENSREHYPLLHPNLSRDLAFHFAVGMPF